MFDIIKKYITIDRIIIGSLSATIVFIIINKQNTNYYYDKQLNYINYKVDTIVDKICRHCGNNRNYLFYH